MPGYSGTPLPKKLGLKPGFRVWLAEMPSDVRGELRAQLDECEIVRQKKACDVRFRRGRGDARQLAVGRVGETVHPAEAATAGDFRVEDK